MRYSVITYTASDFGAGTSANVHINLRGTVNETGKIILRRQNQKTPFKRNHVDKFEFDCQDLGDLRRVIIGHDNTGIGSAWKLTKVEVEEMTGLKRKWFAPCGKWLKKDILERELLVMQI